MPAPKAEELDAIYKDLDAEMDILDWYLKDQAFLCGDEISIADLFIANEVNHDKLLKIVSV